MAARKKTTAVARRGNTSVASIREQLRKEREHAASALGVSGGATVKIADNGDIALPDGTTTDVLACVIIDFCALRTYYDTPMGSQGPPACFAMAEPASQATGERTGDVHARIEPHAEVTDPVHDGPCGRCPLNEFGTADNGRGKGCNERYRLIIADPERPKDDLLQVNVMVSAKAGFEALVNTLDKRHGLSPIEVVTHIGVTQKGSTRFFTFDIGDELSDAQLEPYFARREEAIAMLELPFQPKAEEEGQAPRSRGKKKVTRKKRAA